MDPGGVDELHERLARLARTQEPAQVAALATELLEVLRAVQSKISSARDLAVLELHQSGSSLHEIARGAGLTRGRVFQIVQRGRSEA